MDRSDLIIAIIVIMLWGAIAYRHRQYLAGIFVQRALANPAAAEPFLNQLREARGRKLTARYKKRNQGGRLHIFFGRKEG